MLDEEQLVLLHGKALERRREEAERMTIAVANGYAIARDKKAREDFERARSRRGRGRPRQTPAEFRSTMSRLAAIPGMKVRVN